MIFEITVNFEEYSESQHLFEIGEFGSFLLILFPGFTAFEKPTAFFPAQLGREKHDS